MNIEKVYSLRPKYNDEGEFDRELSPPLPKKIIQESPLKSRDLIIYKYLILDRNRFENTKLEIFRKQSEEIHDVEKVNYEGLWCVSSRFKNFVENNQLSGLDFFPVKVGEERRYLMMWRGLSVISDYEVDIKKSRYWGEEKNKLDLSKVTYRSDVIEHYNNKIFSNTVHFDIYITDELKDLFEEKGFAFTYDEIQVTQKRYSKRKVKKIILNAVKEGQKLYYTQWRKDRLQETDDFLEKVLIEEGNEEVLEKFRTEMKGKWKDQFDRYERGEMPDDERVIYW